MIMEKWATHLACRSVSSPCLPLVTISDLASTTLLHCFVVQVVAQIQSIKHCLHRVSLFKRRNQKPFLNQPTYIYEGPMIPLFLRRGQSWQTKRDMHVLDETRSECKRWLIVHMHGVKCEGLYLDARQPLTASWNNFGIRFRVIARGRTTEVTWLPLWCENGLAIFQDSFWICFNCVAFHKLYATSRFHYLLQ